MVTTKFEFETWIATLQSRICEDLEKVDGHARFISDLWERKEGGGGLTRVLENGKIFEKAGVNVSAVQGEISPDLAKQLQGKGTHFFATGISLVIHPFSPMVPTTHANFRYFELYNEKGEMTDNWFGGGADLTPYYLFEEDAEHFHIILKKACDEFDPSYYPGFKIHCDEYFNNIHRGNERRGVGGIFYDYLRPTHNKGEDFLIDFSKKCGEAFLEAYIPIVQRRRELSYTSEQERWHLIRRGRYVEFNLIHDRGTLFGLRSNGRTESILMSLPPRVRFDYQDSPAPGTLEAALIYVLKHPKNWC